MSNGGYVVVRLFGKLYTQRKSLGLPTKPEVWIPTAGMTAIDLARQLELNLDDIEGVFCNHIVYSLDHVLRPGDEVALVPTGVPGPHRFFLGIHSAGKKKSKL